jgi:SAM-dependent methyltransferase
MNSENVGQDTDSAAKNARFFAHNGRYAQLVSSLETYRQIRLAIDREIAGTRRLLDVGNGGVFEYNTRLVGQIVGVDLCLEDASSTYENIVLRYGDALALKEPDAAYDAVLESSVLHHLVGADVSSTLVNICHAIDEAHRVLEPGGRLIIMEACISKRAFSIERRLFGALRRLARTPLMRHPATLQFPAETIGQVIRDRFGDVTVTQTPNGRLALQFGIPWPSVLTPARPYLFTATRA